MRFPVFALMLVLLTCWCAEGRADGCRCPPQPTRHAHAHVWRHVHVRHWYYASSAGCPIALAHVIRPGCDWSYRQIVPGSELVPSD